MSLVKRDFNKENQASIEPELGRQMRRPPAVGGGADTDIYQNIDEKDINSKLSRLQDLLKKAKNV